MFVCSYPATHCIIYTSVVVLRLNFSGRADRPTVPNHNNMLNYFCRLRLVLLLYIISYSTVVQVYYICICVQAHITRKSFRGGFDVDTPARGKFVGKILKRTRNKKQKKKDVQLYIIFIFNIIFEYTSAFHHYIIYSC